MRFVLLTGFLSAAVWFLSCQKPETPEAVVRKWQAHIDNNEFQKAKELSAPRTVEFLNWMEVLLSEVESDSVITHTELLGLTCRENGERAVCHYSLEDAGEIYRDSFILVRVKGRWLVDVPEEPMPEEGDVEEMFDAMPQDTI